MDFIAIDVETANASRRSICQVGLVQFERGKAVKEFGTYVDPLDEFNARNIRIHGIDEETVAGAPTFAEIAGRLCKLLKGRVVACHTDFDRDAISKACAAHRLPKPDCTWLDTAQVARRAWPQFARRGYGLGNLCAQLGLWFDHHDALEDARAAGVVLLEASRQCGLDLDAWLEQVEEEIEEEIEPHLPRKRAAEGLPRAPIEAQEALRGALSGEMLVFTGSLSIPRPAAQAIAEDLGCRIGSSVTKKTTLLVVGGAGQRTAKYRRAQALMEAGQEIRLLSESTFMGMTTGERLQG